MDNIRQTFFAVQVACATPEHQSVIDVNVPEHCNALQAVQLSGILQQFPELDLNQLALGIFGHRVAATQVLRAGDRVEIYRALIIDPKESRRQRAHRAKSGQPTHPTSRK